MIRVFLILGLGGAAAWFLWRYLHNRSVQPYVDKDGVWRNPDGSVFQGWTDAGGVVDDGGKQIVKARPVGDLTGASSVPPPAASWTGQPVDPAYTPTPPANLPPPPPPPPSPGENTYNATLGLFGYPTSKPAGDPLTGAGSF